MAFETIGDKTLLGRGEEFVSTYPYPEMSVPTYGDVRCLGWIVYQILLPMVLRYDNYTLAVKFYILSGISRLFKENVSY